MRNVLLQEEMWLQGYIYHTRSTEWVTSTNRSTSDFTWDTWVIITQSLTPSLLHFQSDDYKLWRHRNENKNLLLCVTLCRCQSSPVFLCQINRTYMSWFPQLPHHNPSLADVPYLMKCTGIQIVNVKTIGCQLHISKLESLQPLNDKRTRHFKRWLNYQSVKVVVDIMSTLDSTYKFTVTEKNESFFK